MKKRLSPESLFALRSRVLASFFTLNPQSPLTRKPFSPPVIKALIFSYRNRRRSVKVLEASQAAGVKPRRLERRLAKEIGMGFHSWHSLERFALVKERMNVYGDAPEVAMREAGFGKYAFSQFSHFFTARLKRPPRFFFKLCQEETSPEGRLKLQIYYENLTEFQDLMCLVHEGKAARGQKVKAIRMAKALARGEIFF